MATDEIVALVIEDNRSALNARMQLLEASGFKVIGAANAEEALRAFEGARVDLVVTDINLAPGLPNDKSGVDFARAVRALDSHVPIIGYSAAFSEGDLSADEWNTFDRYLPKGSARPGEILQYVTDWKSMAARYRSLRPKRHHDHLELLRAGNTPGVLYSVNTWLAYNIGDQFFGGEHYVWCTPDFDLSSKPRYASTVPPSSCPKEIYYALAEAVRMNDRHSDKIKANGQGVLKGASFRMAAGDITPAQFAEIERIVELANIADFRPLLYIIPSAPVAHVLIRVPVDQRAAPLSPEFILERLPRKYFDVVELR